MDGRGDPHCVGRAGVDCDRPHRYAPRGMNSLAVLVQEAFRYDPHGGDDPLA
jgi:transposase